MSKIGELYREVLEQKIAPVILDVEEESKDKDDVHQRDGDDNNQASVHRHPHMKGWRTMKGASYELGLGASAERCSVLRSC